MAEFSNARRQDDDRWNTDLYKAFLAWIQPLSSAGQRTVVPHWQRFCSATNRDPRPEHLTHPTRAVAEFTAYLAQQDHIAGSTVGTYVRNLHSWFLSRGLEGVLTRPVRRALKQILKLKTSTTRQRDGLTRDILKTIARDSSLDTCIRGAIVLGWALGLRPSTIAPGADPSLALRVSDITIGTHSATIRLRVTKNSVRHGSDVRTIQALQCKDIDPVSWLKILSADARSTGRCTLLPPRLHPLIRAALASAGRRNKLRLTGYSCRIGHVTHALAMGVPVSLLLQQQGWASLKSMLGYIRLDDPTARIISSALNRQATSNGQATPSNY